MSDQGEKTCPLCAEVMDLTDRQLKPCKCGYEICVWCWHHIMEMAEKDDTEGRCPACRTPYDKEKIVGTTANCERLVAEINMEKKKSQKTKPKSSEGRKQLSDFRVIQRNLVYIMGLPLHLGDEDLLHRREYFGQYGKVLKVSMSRTSAGVIQQFPNNTCSVYITYSREDEAVRCIQSVHGYILEGSPLRVCFGTTKYCHAWLRNVPCNNPDCLYLHEIGSQEDSFTKDDVISAYTRSRIQQIIGAANSQLMRSGDVLPPPLDDYEGFASTPKPIIKNGSSTVTTSDKGSPPNKSFERATGLPPAASWAARASNSQPPAALLVSPNGHLKQKSDATDSRVFSSATASIGQTSSSQNYVPKKSTLIDEHNSVHSKGQVDELKPLKHNSGIDPQSTSWEDFSLDGAPATADADSFWPSLVSKGSDSEIGVPSKSSNSLDQIGKSSGTIQEDVCNVYAGGHMEYLCSEMSVMSIDKHTSSQPSVLIRPVHSLSEEGVTRSSEIQGLQLSQKKMYSESSSSSAIGNTRLSINDVYMASNQCDWMTDSQSQTSMITPEIEEDILFFNNQRLKDPEVNSRPSYFSNSSKLLNMGDHSGSHSLQYSGGIYAPSLSCYPPSLENKVSDISSQHVFSGKVVSNGTPESLDQSAVIHSTKYHLHTYKNDGKECMGKHQNDALINSNVSLNSGEDSIISDILSLDFDPWDESSPQALGKWLGDSNMSHDSLSRISKPLKLHNNNQSRFSFARQEEPVSRPINIETPFSVGGQISRNQTFGPFTESRKSFMDNSGFMNNLSSNIYGEPDNLGSGQNAIFPNKLSASRAPVSAPPGFSVPSRSPPPGFSQERVEQTYGLTSGNHLLDASSLLRNSYQTPTTGSIGNIRDIFTDHSNMDVFLGRPNSGPNNLGFDMRSGYPQQLTAIDDETRLQLLLHRSMSRQQSLSYADIGDHYSLMHDSHAINTRPTDQPQVNGLSPFAQLPLQQSRNSLMSNGNWDGWNGVSGANSLNMADLRNERLGFKKIYSGYEDREFSIPCSGDLYSRTFGR